MKARPHSTPYHYRLALVWLANAMKRIERRSPEAESLIKWIRENAFDLCAGLNGKGGHAGCSSACRSYKGHPCFKNHEKGQKKDQENNVGL